MANESSKSDVAEAEETQASFFSSMLFTWVSPLFSIAKAKANSGEAIDMSDLRSLPKQDQALPLAAAFNTAWKKWDAELRTEQNVATGDVLPKTIQDKILINTLFSVMGRRVTYLAGAVKFLNTTIQFCWPVLLGGVLNAVEGKKPFGISGNVFQNGVYVSVVLGLFMAFKAVTENTYFHLVIRGGWQLRSAATTAIFHKSLRLSAVARQSQTVGEIVNLMQIDTSKLEQFIQQLHVIWDGAYQIVGYLALLYYYIGPSTFVGLAVMLLAMPLQAHIMKRLMKLNRTMLEHTDSRVKITNECLQGIRCLKMYSWEDSFIQVISAARQEEVTNLKTIAYLRAFSRAYMSAVPVLTAVASLIVYAYTGGAISPGILFPAITVFSQLRFPLLFYPMVRSTSCFVGLVHLKLIQILYFFCLLLDDGPVCPSSSECFTYLSLFVHA